LRKLKIIEAKFFATKRDFIRNKVKTMLHIFRKDTVYILVLLVLFLKLIASNPVELTYSTDYNEDEKQYSNNIDESILISRRIDSLMNKITKSYNGLEKIYEILVSRPDLIATIRNEKKNRNNKSIEKRNSFSHKHSSAISSILNKIKNNG